MARTDWPVLWVGSQLYCSNKCSVSGATDQAVQIDLHIWAGKRSLRIYDYSQCFLFFNCSIKLFQNGLMHGEFEFVRHSIIKLYRDKVSAWRLGGRRSVDFAETTEPGGRRHSALIAP